MSYMTIAHVIIVLLVLKRVSTKSISPEPRTLVDFYKFTLHFTKRNPLDYVDYGCWCGVDHRGETVMDEIDSCCKTHDACYKGWTSLNSYYTITTDWMCGDNPSSGQYKACMCDREAAQCFARNIYQKSMKGRCDNK